MDNHTPKHAATMPRTQPSGGGIPERNLNTQLFSPGAGGGKHAGPKVKMGPNRGYRGAHAKTRGSDSFDWK